MAITINKNESVKVDVQPVLFLSWESPWPAHSGAALRTLGLLKELSRRYLIDLIVLTRNPLSSEQNTVLGSYVRTITRIPLLDVTHIDKVRVITWIVKKGYPYHSAILLSSLHGYPEIKRRIQEFPGIVFTSTGHWGSLIFNRRAPNWILNQCDADVDFWRVYATQVDTLFSRLVAKTNYWLAKKHYPPIYANVARVISVCEEDRLHTLNLAPHARVEVIENGVDCSYYLPCRGVHTGPPRLLFTGTSASRNITALRQFMSKIWPLIQQKLSETELTIAGNFRPEAQVEFKQYKGIHFTGRVDDIRPYFDQSDVFIAPFEETHGSKLKVAEAMAMGMPIVSTPQGIRGFPVADGKSILIAVSNEQFATHVIDLLNNATNREKLGVAARQTAVETVDWQILGKRLAKVVEAVQNDLHKER